MFAILLCILALIDFGQAMWKWTHHYDVPYVYILSPILVALAMVILDLLCLTVAYCFT